MCVATEDIECYAVEKKVQFTIMKERIMKFNLGVWEPESDWRQARIESRIWSTWAIRDLEDVFDACRRNVENVLYAASALYITPSYDTSSFSQPSLIFGGGAVSTLSIFQMIFVF